MQRDLHPSDGARYLFELEHAEGSRARYRVAIYTRDAAFTGTATLDEAGGVELSPTGGPDELHGRLATIAKLIARDAGRLHSDGMPPWPNRILRWRR